MSQKFNSSFVYKCILWFYSQNLVNQINYLGDNCSPYLSHQSHQNEQIWFCSSHSHLFRTCELFLLPRSFLSLFVCINIWANRIICPFVGQFGLPRKKELRFNLTSLFFSVYHKKLRINYWSWLHSNRSLTPGQLFNFWQRKHIYHTQRSYY